jgi:hypothetical protein
LTPLGAVGGPKTVLGRNGNRNRGNPLQRPRKNLLERRVAEERHGYSAIQECVVGLAPYVSRVSVRPHEGNLTVDAGNHTQEVVVGEVRDDDV